ncbi:MAG: hypothetical protein WBC93_04555 [Sulfitobacter sp.]
MQNIAMNDRINDASCPATKTMPKSRETAALAKPKKYFLAKSCVLFVWKACCESVVFIPARTPPMNGRIDDTRCVAIKQAPRLRANAA